MVPGIRNHVYRMSDGMQNHECNGIRNHVYVVMVYRTMYIMMYGTMYTYDGIQTHVYYLVWCTDINSYDDKKHSNHGIQNHVTMY